MCHYHHKVKKLHFHQNNYSLIEFFLLCSRCALSIIYLLWPVLASVAVMTYLCNSFNLNYYEIAL